MKKRIVHVLFVGICLSATQNWASDFDCWTLPPCYTISFSEKNKTNAVMAYGKNDLRFLDYAEKPYYCLENIQKENNSCQYFYHCKPLNYQKANNIEFESKDFVELRWELQGNELLKEASIRSSDKKRSKWSKVNTKFKKTTTISSNNPSCTLSISPSN